MLEGHTVFWAILALSKVPMLIQYSTPPGEKCGLKAVFEEIREISAQAQ
jgi:hypothetical protein